MLMIHPLNKQTRMIAYMSEIIYKDPNRFYVYSYLREDGSPYYIGKGSGRRIKETRRTIKAPFDKARIVILKKDMNEQEAFQYEIELIKKYGRKNNETGILRNLTDGGEGTSGLKHSDAAKANLRERNLGKKHSDAAKAKMREAKLTENLSDATREKIKEAQLGKIVSDDTKEKIREARLGKKHSDDTKEKMREARLGKKHSDDTKEKMREARLGKPSPNLGKKLSPETIKKRTESRKRNKEAKL